MGPGGWGGCFERVLEGLTGGRPEAEKWVFPKMSLWLLGGSPWLWGCPRASGGAPRALLGPLGPHRAHGGAPPLMGTLGPYRAHVGPLGPP